MSTVRYPNAFAKVAMALMLVLSGLISGCTGNDEKEWKKASDDFIIAYSDLIEFYNKRAVEQVPRSRNQQSTSSVLQDVSFVRDYLLRPPFGPDVSIEHCLCLLSVTDIKNLG
jgi:hypothetical protein